MNGPMGMDETGSVHETVGAYALGILDPAEASAFEEHLAQCAYCAAQLDELSGMEPVLGTLAQTPVRAAPPEPSPKLLARLADEVARRRRRFLLVAAAVVLLLTSPFAVLAATGGDENGGRVPEAHPTSPAEDAFFNHMAEKVAATDAGTDVMATVGMEEKPWGTHAVLELKNVKGPLKCSLIAVGKNGERETVTSWSVPKWGYGIENSSNKWARSPLYVHGGAAMDRSDIDHFEVRTFDGKRLVEVGA